METTLNANTKLAKSRPTPKNVAIKARFENDVLCWKNNAHVGIARDSNKAKVTSDARAQTKNTTVKINT